MLKLKGRTSPLLSLAVAALLMAAACSSTLTIRQIAVAPDRYSEQHVVVRGKVVQTFAIPVLGQSLVKIDDGTGQLWVKPRNRVPFKGQEIEISGTLRIGIVVANKNLGIVLYEDEAEEKPLERGFTSTGIPFVTLVPEGRSMRRSSQSWFEFAPGCFVFATERRVFTSLWPKP